MPGEIRERPNRQSHQAHEEKRRKSQDAVNHFPLGDQVHEITRHQERFAGGNHQRNANIHRAMAERDVRGPYGNQRAEQQRVKHEEIPPNVVAEMFRMRVAHISK